MPDFGNTEIAFSGRTDRELRRSYRLFKMMSSPTLVSVGTGLARVALALRFPIDWAVKPTVFRQFVGGVSLDDCAPTIRELAKHRIATILDYSAEGKQDEADFDRCAEQIIATIRRIRDDRFVPFTVFKVTAIGSFALLEKLHAKEALSSDDSWKSSTPKRRSPVTRRRNSRACVNG